MIPCNLHDLLHVVSYNTTLIYQATNYKSNNGPDARDIGWAPETRLYLICREVNVVLGLVRTLHYRSDSLPGCCLQSTVNGVMFHSPYLVATATLLPHTPQLQPGLLNGLGLSTRFIIGVLSAIPSALFFGCYLTCFGSTNNWLEDFTSSSQRVSSNVYNVSASNIN